MSVLARLCVFVAIALLPLGVAAKSKAPIVLGEGPEISQQIVASITARALEKAGFKYEIVRIDDAAVVAALTSNALHAHLSLPEETATGLSAAAETRALTLLGGLKGNQMDEPVLKVVSPGMKRKWPYAQKMMKRMVLAPEIVAGLVREVETGRSVDDVAGTWMTANKKTWTPWIAASKNWMKP